MSRSTSRRRRPRGPTETLVAPALIVTSPIWVLALHHAVSDLLLFRSVAPSVVLVATASVAWRSSPLAAVAFATLIGCWVDVASDVPFGMTAARLGLLTGVCVELRRALALEEVPGGSVIVVLGFAVVERCLAAITLDAWAPAADLSVLIPRACWIGLYTALLAPIGFAVVGTIAGAPREHGRFRTRR